MYVVFQSRWCFLTSSFCLLSQIVHHICSHWSLSVIKRSPYVFDGKVPLWAPLDGTPPQKVFLVFLRGIFPGKRGEGKCMWHVSILTVCEITCACISLERLRQFQKSTLNNDHLGALYVVVCFINGSCGTWARWERLSWFFRDNFICLDGGFFEAVRRSFQAIVFYFDKCVCHGIVCVYYGVVWVLVANPRVYRVFRIRVSMLTLCWGDEKKVVDGWRCLCDSPHR